jgi:hypothetical protein
MYGRALWNRIHPSFSRIRTNQTNGHVVAPAFPPEDCDNLHIRNAGFGKFPS